MADILIAVFILAPAVLAYFLKSNAAISFLALCAGISLSNYADLDVQRLINHLGFWSSLGNIDLFLIIVPLALSLLLVRRSSHGLSKFLHIAAGLLAGYLLALTVIPALGDNGAISLSSSHWWFKLTKIQSYGVGVGAVLSLVMIWMTNLKLPKKH